MLLNRSRQTLLIVSSGVALLSACGRDERRADDLLRADLAAAAQAPSMRQQFVSPQELGYPQGYAPNGMPQYAYPQQYPQPYGYPQPYPQNAVYTQPARVVYVPQPAPARRTSAAARTSSAGSAGSSAGTAEGSVQESERNTTRGAVIGAATGTAVGILTSRDKVKGGAVGAVAGAVLGGVVGSQIYTKPRK